MSHLRRLAPLALLLASSCAYFTPPPAAVRESADATAATQRRAAAFAALPLDDPQDFSDARRGHLAYQSRVFVQDAAGRTVWDTQAYAFLEGEAPPTVNPSLWRQARLNAIHGLFQVTEGVYQVRGYDLSNMTIIEGETGRIVVDPLTARETAAAAWGLVERQLGPRPISAVIFTHSHIDHFGGIEGVISAEDIRKNAVRVIAPAGFVEESTSENVIAGIAMRRRADLMYGRRLERGPKGHVDTGLGVSPAFGSVSLVPPTEVVSKTPTETVIDGVRFVFQYTPESEAPAELMFYLPELRALCGAEVVSRTMHNLYTLRGAKVRDALRWAGYIDEALQLFGDDVEVMFASHHWPTWGNASIVDYLEKQRDTYKFIHDQTLRLASSGATPREIAEQLELPDSLARSFANRGYYGTVRHNAKAVYQWYFGWYDGNPANLDPHPPVAQAKRYVAALGGAPAVRAKAQAAYEAGDYRWAATLLDHAVFANPADDAAREQLAQTYEQLGYAAESGPWRDVYLTGALELREGEPSDGPSSLASAVGLLRHTPIERFFDAFATRLDAEKADGVELAIDFVFTDTRESYRLWVQNSVLHHRRAEPSADADATVRLTKPFFLKLILGQAGAGDLLFSRELDIEGSPLQLRRFFSLLEAPDESFAIVVP